jgi:hypothetical protein
MEPVTTPTQWGWNDETEAPAAEWWTGEEPAWQAPELALDEDWGLVLNGARAWRRMAGLLRRLSEPYADDQFANGPPCPLVDDCVAEAGILALRRAL